MTRARPTLLMVGLDSAKTTTVWEWLEPSAKGRQFSSIARQELEAVLTPLMDSIPAEDDHESIESTLRRVLNESGFSSPAKELAMSRSIGDALLPKRVRLQIAESYLENDGHPILIRMLPSQLCAQVPWELIPIEVPGRRGRTQTKRLIELADLVYDIPAGAHIDRAAVPRPWDSKAPALYVVDPPTGVEGGVLDQRERDRFSRRMAAQPAAWPRGGDRVTRIGLSSLLRDERPSRLVFVGHVVTPKGNAAGTSLMLSDPGTVYGRTGSIGDDDATNRPLSALDLMVGTLDLETHLAALADDEQLDAATIVWPHQPDTGLPGAMLWPMPPRVALIACSSGSDLRSPEPFGLATATINAGAELVTATKWTLLTDYAYRRLSSAGNDASPLTNAALDIDSAHTTADPIESIAAWQRRCLADWEASGRIAASPILWSAVSNYDGSARQVLRRRRAL